MTEQTPGPWLWIRQQPSNGLALVTDDPKCNGVVMEVYGASVWFPNLGGDGPDGDCADARLIAAAPDLLAVCERINALRRNPPEAGGIGDLLGGLGDWLEDTIAAARGEKAP